MKLLAAALLLSLAPLSAAQTGLPEKPLPRFDRRIFWTGISLLATAKTADALETERVLSAGGHENNPLFGRHPSPARLGIENAAIFAGQAALFRFTEKNPHRWIRWTGRAALAYAISAHALLAACNAGIAPHGPIRNCPIW